MRFRRTNEDAYPPAEHVLRDLGAEFEQHGDGRASARLPIDQWVRNPSGSVHAGALATLVDLLGGGLAAVTVAPDWIATADLTLHALGRPAGPEVRAGARVLHAGRTTAVIEVTLADGTGPLGLATMSFARLARRDDNPIVPPSTDGTRASLRLPGSGLREPLVDRAGFVVVDAPRGAVELPLTPYVGNSLGAVQGGVIATAVAVATDAIVADHVRDPVETVDLQVTYLSLVKTSPLRTTARLIDDCTASVSVVDGAGRLATSATATAVPRSSR
jgi:uncharacterized protein (TIGR00369 family)